MYKSHKKLLENAKLHTTASEALWLIYVCVRREMKSILSSQSLFFIRASPFWRFWLNYSILFNHLKVKVKPCWSTSILSTPWWSERALLSARVSASGNGGWGGLWHALTARLGVKLKNVGHAEVNSYIRSMQHSVMWRCQLMSKYTLSLWEDLYSPQGW